MSSQRFIYGVILSGFGDQYDDDSSTYSEGDDSELQQVVDVLQSFLEQGEETQRIGITDQQKEKLEIAPEELFFESESPCCICLDIYKQQSQSNVTILPCDHYFHQRCIDSWFAQSGNCPTCRRDV